MQIAYLFGVIFESEHFWGAALDLFRGILELQLQEKLRGSSWFSQHVFVGTVKYCLLTPSVFGIGESFCVLYSVLVE